MFEGGAGISAGGAGMSAGGAGMSAGDLANSASGSEKFGAIWGFNSNLGA